MNAPEVRVGDRPVDDEVPGLVIVVERVVVKVVPCGGLDLVAEPGDECGRGRVPEGEGHVGGVRKAFPPQNSRPLEGIGRLTAEATAGGERFQYGAQRRQPMPKSGKAKLNLNDRTSTENASKAHNDISSYRSLPSTISMFANLKLAGFASRIFFFLHAKEKG